MVPDDEQQTTISREADDYELSEGECLSKPMSIKERYEKSPCKYKFYGSLCFLVQLNYSTS